MNIVAIMPIKMHNERYPGKNIRKLGDWPLLQWELRSIVNTGLCDSVNVFCSTKRIIPYLPKGVNFVERPKYLDLPTSNFSQIFDEFMQLFDADIYVYIHATAPFVTKETMEQCIKAVLSGKFDSSFCAKKLQDYLWQEGKPLNFNAEIIPRTQDLKPVYQETSGIYVFKKEVFQALHRRVGLTPFIKVISYKEAIDIDTQEDFKLAEALLNVDL